MGTLISRLVILLGLRRLRVLHDLVLDLYLSVSLMPSLQFAPDDLLIEFEFRHERLHLTYSLYLRLAIFLVILSHILIILGLICHHDVRNGGKVVDRILNAVLAV